jgi:hypothetical protein
LFLLIFSVNMAVVMLVWFLVSLLSWQLDAREGVPQMDLEPR